MAASKESNSQLLKKVLLTELADESEEAALVHVVRQSQLTSKVALRLLQNQETSAYIENYVEVTVPQYTVSQFKNHFRMFPETFEAYCQWLGPHLPTERYVSTEKKILATIWLLANKETYRSVADRFGMNRGSLHRIVKAVCQAIISLRGDVIRWPNDHELQRLSEKFEAAAGFPGVVGAMDGTYIKITGKTDDTRDAYICRKGFPSMHLQVVCNPDLLFLDVETGNVGSVHDSRVFRNSSVHALLESEERRLPSHFHLLGDSAYPLRDYLLVPFRDNGHLTHTEVKFNTVHSRTRVVVERAIGLLKGKFRRLKDLDMTNMLEVPNVIFAACATHNFLILRKDVDMDDDDIEMPEREEEVCEEDQMTQRVSSVEKRLRIARLLDQV